MKWILNKLENEIKKTKSTCSANEQLKREVLKRNPTSKILKLLNRNMVNPNRYYLMEESEVSYGEINIAELNDLDTDLFKAVSYFLDKNEEELLKLNNKYKNMYLTRAYLIRLITANYVKDKNKIANIKEEMEDIIRELEGENLYIYSLFLAIELYNKCEYIDALRFLKMIRKYLYYDKNLFLLATIYETYIRYTLDSSSKKQVLEELLFYLREAKFEQDEIYLKLYEITNEEDFYISIKDGEKKEILDTIKEIINEQKINKTRKNRIVKAINGEIDEENFNEEESFYIELGKLLDKEKEIRNETLNEILEEKAKTKNIVLYKRTLDLLVKDKYIPIKPTDFKRYYYRYLELKEEIKNEE